MNIEIVGGEEHGVLDGMNVKSVAWEKPFEVQRFTLSGDLVSGGSIYPRIIRCGLFDILVTIPRKKRANFRSHLRRRLKLIQRGRR